MVDYESLRILFDTEARRDMHTTGVLLSFLILRAGIHGTLHCYFRTSTSTIDSAFLYLGRRSGLGLIPSFAFSVFFLRAAALQIGLAFYWVAFMMNTFCD